MPLSFAERKVSTDLHLTSGHTFTETYQCWRRANFAMKKGAEATALEVLGQR